MQSGAPEESSWLFMPPSSRHMGGGVDQQPPKKPQP